MTHLQLTLHAVTAAAAAALSWCCAVASALFLVALHFTYTTDNAPTAHPACCCCSALCCAVASALFMVGLWVTGLQPAPKVDKGFMLALMPVALFHTIGHVSACVSFSQVRMLCDMP
jgi:hypothetical protein